MPNQYLKFIRNNEPEELIKWAQSYADNPLTLQVENTQAAWEIIQTNVNNLKIEESDESKKNMERILLIMLELLRWNDAPQCLIDDRHDQNFFTALLYKAAFDPLPGGRIRNLLYFVIALLEKVDIGKIPQNILFTLAIYCIKNPRDDNITPRFISILSILLKKCPFLLETRDWNASLKFIYHNVRIESINLLSIALTTTYLVKPAVLRLILQYLVKQNQDNLDILKIPFGIRLTSIEKVSDKYIKCDFNSHLTDEDSVRVHMEKNLNATKMLHSKPYVYIIQTYESEVVNFYFSYPYESRKGFNLFNYTMNINDYPKNEYGQKRHGEAIQQVKRALLKAKDFSSMSVDFINGFFNDNTDSYDKSFEIKEILGMLKIDFRQFIIGINEDNKKIHLIKQKMNECGKSDNDLLKALNGMILDLMEESKNNRKKSVLKSDDVILIDNNLANSQVLDETNQFLNNLINYSKDNTPKNFLKNKFKSTLRELLLVVLTNENILSTLMKYSGDDLYLIDPILDKLENLRATLSIKIDRPAFIIPSVFYQLSVNNIYQEYNKQKQKCNTLNMSICTEVVLRDSYQALTVCFRELIRIVDIYLDVITTEKKEGYKNIISLLTIDKDDVQAAVLENIFEDVLNENYLDLFLSDLVRIINICQSPFSLELNFSEISQKIILKSLTFKQLNTFYNAQEYESFYAYPGEKYEDFAPLAEHYKKLSELILTMARLFKKDKKIDATISFDRKEDKNLDVLKVKVNYYFDLALSLVKLINETNIKLLPNPKEKNFFKIMIDLVVEDTIKFGHAMLLKIMNSNLEQDIYKERVSYLQKTKEIFSLLLDQFTNINKYLNEDIKNDLKKELLVINNSLAEPDFFDKKQDQATIIFVEEKQDKRHAPQSSARFYSKSNIQLPSINTNTNVGRNKKSEDSGVFKKISNMFASAKTTKTFESADSIFDLDQGNGNGSTAPVFSKKN